MGSKQFFTRWYLKLRFVTNTFLQKIPKGRHCVLDRSMRMLLGKGFDPIVSDRIGGMGLEYLPP